MFHIFLFINMWLDNVELKAIARQIGMTPVDYVLQQT